MARRTKRNPWNLRLMDADRCSKGWTHQELAVNAGTSCATVTRFLDGKFKSPKTAKKLAMALGYPLDRYLLIGVAA